jgi:hypothetical protein
VQATEQVPLGIVDVFEIGLVGDVLDGSLPGITLS